MKPIGISSYPRRKRDDTKKLALALTLACLLGPASTHAQNAYITNDFASTVSVIDTATDTVIATIPVGYADGWSRLLSNRGAVLVRGRRAPIAGRVCMDLCMVDVTDVPGVEVGDEVVLIGRQGTEVQDAHQLAALQGTIAYDVLCAVGARVPRVIQ